MATDCVDFVDEHDTRRVFLGLFEHVADTACANANEHFHKVRPRDGKERHACLACNRTRQQCFTCTRRAHQKRAFGDFPAQAAKFLGIAQEFYDFFQFFFGFINACNIVKCHTALLFGQKLCLGFAKAHRATFAAALHAVHEIDPHTDQQQEGENCHKEGLKPRLFLGLGPNCDVIGDQEFGDIRIHRPDRDIFTFVGSNEFDLFAVQRHR